MRGSMFLEHAFALLGGSEWLRSIAGDMSKNEYEGARRRWQVKSMVAVFVLRLRECFRTVTEIFAFFMHSVCLAGDVVLLFLFSVTVSDFQFTFARGGAFFSVWILLFGETVFHKHFIQGWRVALLLRNDRLCRRYCVMDKCDFRNRVIDMQGNSITYYFENHCCGGELIDFMKLCDWCQSKCCGVCLLVLLLESIQTFCDVVTALLMFVIVALSLSKDSFGSRIFMTFCSTVDLNFECHHLTWMTRKVLQLEWFFFGNFQDYRSSFVTTSDRWRDVTDSYSKKTYDNEPDHE